MSGELEIAGWSVTQTFTIAASGERGVWGGAQGALTWRASPEVPFLLHRCSG